MTEAVSTLETSVNFYFKSNNINYCHTTKSDIPKSIAPPPQFSFTRSSLKLTSSQKKMITLYNVSLYFSHRKMFQLTAAHRN